MKKNIVFGFLLLVLSILVSSPTFSQGSALDSVETKSDCLLSKRKAILIAQPIWVKAFGKSIYKQKPFIATLSTSGVWLVKGTLNTKRGGVPYIEIRKSDCAILRVWHTK
jgi:hypothetical protein